MHGQGWRVSQTEVWTEAMNSTHSSIDSAKEKAQQLLVVGAVISFAIIWWSEGIRGYDLKNQQDVKKVHKELPKSLWRWIHKEYVSIKLRPLWKTGSILFIRLFNNYRGSSVWCLSRTEDASCLQLLTPPTTPSIHPSILSYIVLVRVMMVPIPISSSLR